MSETRDFLLRLFGDPEGDVSCHVCYPGASYNIESKPSHKKYEVKRFELLSISLKCKIRDVVQYIKGGIEKIFSEMQNTNYWRLYFHSLSIELGGELLHLL